MSPDGTRKCKINFILTDKKGIGQNVEVSNRVTTGSDYWMVQVKVMLDLWREKRTCDGE